MHQQIWSTVRTLLTSRKTLMTTVAGTGGYVAYTDIKRDQHMVRAIEHGKLLSPLSESEFEPVYHRRPELEERLRHILGPSFTNQYYLVTGAIGAGKSRTLVEMVKSLIEESGSKGHGAPIYVLTTQQKQFSDTLGNAINFRFDEHVNFRFFLQYVTQISRFPARDHQNKLQRVLNAIEQAANRYQRSHGRPMVLVIDGISTNSSHVTPTALQALQEKAKLWADQNICKVVLVCSDEKSEEVLRSNTSCWSRAAEPLYVSDLSKEQAIRHLCASQMFQGVEVTQPPMTESQAEQIYNTVGGRILYLNIFKRDYFQGVGTEETKRSLKSKEREKFRRICETPRNWDVVNLLRKAPEMTMYLSDLVLATSKQMVDDLILANVLRVVSDDGSVKVKFESRLTENTVEEMYTRYNPRK